MDYKMPDGSTESWPKNPDDQQRLVNRFNGEPEEKIWPVERPAEGLACLRCHHEFRAGDAPQDHQGSLCPNCGSGETAPRAEDGPANRTSAPRVRGKRRLSRHEKQRVRRFLRQEARKHGRAHRGDRGSVLGLRFLIRDANHGMSQGGRDACIMYPQAEGCGLVYIEEILAAG